MRTMGLVALYPKRILSAANQAHKIYPYRLRGLAITRPNQVWATDITYIPMARGFVYLVAVMDWYSRRVLSWRVSNTMDTRFCIYALTEAIERYGSPAIFNTDQGRQYTSFVASLAILLLSPIMFLTAIAVSLKLGRPILFRQMRPGLDGI
jgi:putative transposase